MMSDDSLGEHPVIARIEDFDHRSGTWLERLLFNNRVIVMALCLVATVFLGLEASNLTLNASFEKTIPTGHPHIQNFLAHRSELGGLGNSVRIAVEADHGTIFDKNYMETLRRINDEVFLLPGVDRPFMKSLWTPATRWTAVTELGLDGGPVIPDGFDGSPAGLEQLRANVERSGEIGQLVASNLKSSVIFVPLLDIEPETGKPLDYRAFSDSLEKLRETYEPLGVRLHITGFAKIVGDLIAGLEQVLAFFLAAVVIAFVVVLVYTRCMRSTLVVMCCSLIAVGWQMGLLALLGYQLDPYSVLVPFLVFAIGMSHGAQKMNGIMQDVGRGTHKLVAARYTFRRLFIAGLTALLCDAVGFAVLIIIDIQAIKDLAIIASIGVAVLIFTNLILLPILLSFIGVSRAAAARSLREGDDAGEGGPDKHWAWRFLDLFTRRGPALAAVIVAAVMAGGGYWVSLGLKVGDLDPGAPELQPDSTYNRDSAFMVANYAASSDILVVMIKTPNDRCTSYATLSRVDELAWRLRQLPGVEATNSMAAIAKLAGVGFNEGNFKWFDLIPNEGALGVAQTIAPRESFNKMCSLLTLYVYLADHRADTLARVVETVEGYAENNPDPDVRFLLAAGNAGIESATNAVVGEAMHEMLIWVYGAVIILCFITFRSWRAVLVAVLPLMLTSILCEALMVALGMGVKVATLPVIALGVGIGVDYALYVLSIVLAHLRAGESLSVAYYRSLLFTGRVVMLTGLTLAVAVATWYWSPIKFQADMGILLAFMFLWNMLGALILLPALAHFLLPRGATHTVTTNADASNTVPA